LLKNESNWAISQNFTACMMLSIIHASYLDDYKIALSFNNNKMGVANLKDLIFTDHRAPFLMLLNENEFKQFNIEHDTIVWKNGLDLAPEFLFFITFKESPEFQHQFQAWGHL
jgi:hypothetical protein